MKGCVTREPRRGGEDAPQGLAAGPEKKLNEYAGNLMREILLGSSYQTGTDGDRIWRPGIYNAESAGVTCSDTFDAYYFI